MRILPDTRTIWRWHFYAGLFCVPFVLWLSATGTIFLFKPQIEAWMDRPYSGLLIPGATPATPEQQVKAALAAVPGSNVHFYELPRSAGDAPQIVVGKAADEFRVYVHPVTARPLQVVNEDNRLMKRVSHLHGELMAGDRGSMVIELAGSWTIVLVLTGLVLWWPRGQAARLGGTLYPRFNMPGRAWWRDLHSVTGMWVSLFTLTLLITGLPWAKSWGSYFKKARSVAAGMTIQQDWPTGSSSEAAARLARNGDPSAPATPDAGVNHGVDHSMHQGGGAKAVAVPRPGKKNRQGGVPAPDAYVAINTLLPKVEALKLAFPVPISPPLSKGGAWTAKSDSQDRTIRETYTFDSATLAVLSRESFADKAAMDRVVSLGISVHEGHLFGWLNQAISLFTAVGVALLAVSSVVLWWKRRPRGVLGAPVPLVKPAISFALVTIVVMMSIAFPMLGASIVALAVLEFAVLSRIPPLRTWLGLRTG